MWFNESTLQIDAWNNPVNMPTIPVPNFVFPFQRICAAFVANSTSSYVYHQVNESTMAQEQWDEDLWQPSVSISINVETSINYAQENSSGN